jgi:hypothetical protein
MIETFTPKVKEETDSASHKLIRAATKAPVTEDDIPFTTKYQGHKGNGQDKSTARGQDNK